MSASANSQSSLPYSGCPHAKRRRAESGHLCVHAKRKDRCFICTTLSFARSYAESSSEQPRMEQLDSPLFHHGAPGTSSATPQTSTLHPRRVNRIQLGVTPSVAVTTGKQSLVVANVVPMQSAHHEENLNKCKVDVDEIIGMLEALTRSLPPVDPGSLSQTASSTDSFGQALDNSLDVSSQSQAVIHRHSFLQSFPEPTNSALPDPEKGYDMLQRLPLNAYSFIEQAERSQLSYACQEHFHSLQQTVDSFNQRPQDVSDFQKHAHHPQECASIYSFGEQQQGCISKERLYPIPENISDCCLHSSPNARGLQRLVFATPQTEDHTPFAKQIMHAQPVVMSSHPRHKKGKRASVRYKKHFGSQRNSEQVTTQHRRIMK